MMSINCSAVSVNCCILADKLLISNVKYPVFVNIGKLELVLQYNMLLHVFCCMYIYVSGDFHYCGIGGCSC